MRGMAQGGGQAAAQHQAQDGHTGLEQIERPGRNALGWAGAVRGGKQRKRGKSTADDAVELRVSKGL